MIPVNQLTTSSATDTPTAVPPQDDNKMESSPVTPGEQETTSSATDLSTTASSKEEIPTESSPVTPEDQEQTSTTSVSPSTSVSADESTTATVTSTESGSSTEESSESSEDASSSSESSEEPMPATVAEQSTESTSSAASPQEDSSDPATSTTVAGPSTVSASTAPTAAAPASNRPAGGDQCEGEGFYEDPTDCRKFIRCVGGSNTYRKFNFDCGPGTAWDQSLLTCNYIDQVASCGSEANEIPLGSGEGGQSKPTGEAGVSSSGPGTASSAGGNSKPKIVCNEEGFFGNPTRCNKFYRCVANGNGFQTYQFDCPPGTIFDPSISICNHPGAVYPARDCSTPGTAGTPTEGTTAKPSTPSLTTSDAASMPSELPSTDGAETAGTTASAGVTTQSTGTETDTTEAAGGETTAESSTTGAEDAATDAQSTTTSGEATTESAGETTTAGESASTPDSTESPVTTEAGGESEGTTETAVATTESQESTNEPESTTAAKTDAEPGMVTPCPIGNLTDEQIVLVCPTGFKRHPKYCNMFYQCSTEADMKIRILVLGCPEGTIFDEDNIKCTPEAESSKPCDSEIATARFIRQLESTSVSPVRNYFSKFKNH